MNSWIKIVIIIAFFILPGQARALKPKVLIISSYHPSYEWAFECEKGIQKELDGLTELEYYHMDTKRIPEKEFATRADSAWTMYLNEHPDLVMIGDDNALRLVGPRLGSTQTPVVYYGINDNPRVYFDKMPANMTGIMERTPILPFLRYIRSIIPTTRSALVLMDQSQTSNSYVDIVFNNQKDIDAAGIHVTYKIAEDWDMWKQSVLTVAASYDILVASSYHAVKRKDGSHVNLHKVIEWTSANSPLPVFTNQEYSVYDTGAVGAFVTDGESHGSQAAAIALKIIKEGKRPADIPPETDRSETLYFNLKQLQRFKLTLPEDIKQIARFLK